jgi:5-deoxy-glucuronate isomerase
LPTGRLLRAGSFDTVLPVDAGWRYLSLELVQGGAAGDQRPIEPDGVERAIVVLSGSCSVHVGDRAWELPGRPSAFDGPPWAAYLSAGTAATVRTRPGAELAVVGARSDRAGEPRLIAPDDVAVEVRGAGSATRQIHHIVPPEFPAHRLLVVEVLTPAGNWSSYPPHKHDEDRAPAEAELEEFYLFRVRPPEGFGFQRVYSLQHDEDVSEAVRDGDVVLIPYGYHVSGAAHGFDLYYLNGLAGDRRSMAASDDPALAWIRPSWEGMATDARLPLRWT